MAVLPASVPSMLLIDHQKTASALAATGLCLNLLLGGILIHYEGAVGAAIALSLAQSIMVVIYLAMRVPRYLEVRF